MSARDGPESGVGPSAARTLPVRALIAGEQSRLARTMLVAQIGLPRPQQSQGLHLDAGDLSHRQNGLPIPTRRESDHDRGLDHDHDLGRGPARARARVGVASLGWMVGWQAGDATRPEGGWARSTAVSTWVLAPTRAGSH